MSANQVFLVVLAISIIVSLYLHVASIKWGLHWTNTANISILKAFGLLVVIVLVQWLTMVVVSLVLVGINVKVGGIAEGIIGIALQFAAASFSLAIIYKVSARRAAIAALPLFFVSIGLVLIAFFVIRPFAYEAFSIPTNPMAPTLLGEYVEAPCPNCGQPAYTTPPDQFSHAFPEGLQMICGKERQAVYVKDAPKEFGHGDRITVCKFVKPKRWDLIVFRYPGNPSVNYAMRLVGLPGEKLEIKDGAIWINGERMEPPESIREILYSPTVHAYGKEYSGPGSVPVELGSDEYFVLGDFVDAASDSRMWERGAPGHPPYAVPASHIVGVVINIYWPPDRWTSFR